MADPSLDLASRHGAFAPVAPPDPARQPHPDNELQRQPLSAHSSPTQPCVHEHSLLKKPERGLYAHRSV